jgi:hypothetical protein
MPRYNRPKHSLKLPASSQQLMSPSAASAKLGAEKKSALVTKKNNTLCDFWMRERLLKKELRIIFSEDATDSLFIPKKETEACDSLLSTTARDIWDHSANFTGVHMQVLCSHRKSRFTNQNTKMGFLLDSSKTAANYLLVPCECCTCNLANIQRRSNLEGNNH